MILVRETQDGFERVTDTTVTAPDGGKIRIEALRRAIERGDTDTAERYGVEVATVAPVPEGKRAVGPSRIERRNGKVVIARDLEDIPPEPVLTDAEMLEAATGLTVARIKAVLGNGVTAR